MNDWNFEYFQKCLTCLAMLSRIVLKPGRPYMSFGGKYVPPETGFRSGVKKTDIGHPPDPELA